MMNPRQNRDMPFHMFPANTHNPFKRSMISLWYWQINPTIVQMVRNKRIEDNRLDKTECSSKTFLYFISNYFSFVIELFSNDTFV
jgi:hypothetical protein